MTRVMTREEAQKAFPGVVFSGDQFTIENGVVIKGGAAIKSGSWLGYGAVIERGAWIGSVSHKYNGNVVPLPDKTLIRIGCEVHTPQEWAAGKKIAQRHHELDWWQEHGKAMLQFLRSEAKQYDKEYRRVTNA